MKLISTPTVIGLLLLFLTSGCGGNSDPAEPSQSNPAQQENNHEKSADTSKATLQYPALYTKEKLPQYAEATLISTGRQTSSLRDGIRLELQSSQPVQTIAKFYEKELKSLGWDVPVPKFRNEMMFGANCTKENLKYMLTITKMPEGQPTKININFLSD